MGTCRNKKASPFSCAFDVGLKGCMWAVAAAMCVDVASAWDITASMWAIIASMKHVAAFIWAAITFNSNPSW